MTCPNCGTYCTGNSIYCLPPIVDLAEVRKAKKAEKEKADRKRRIKRIIAYAKTLNW